MGCCYTKFPDRGAPAPGPLCPASFHCKSLSSAGSAGSCCCVCRGGDESRAVFFSSVEWCWVSTVSSCAIPWRRWLVAHSGWAGGSCILQGGRNSLRHCSRRASAFIRKTLRCTSTGVRDTSVLSRVLGRTRLQDREIGAKGKVVACVRGPCFFRNLCECRTCFRSICTEKQLQSHCKQRQWAWLVGMLCRVSSSPERTGAA